MQISDMFSKLVNRKFFNPLTGRNQSFYAYCILTLYDQSIMTSSVDFDRGLVNYIIGECMELFHGRLADEEIEGDDPPGQTSVSTVCPLTRELVFYRLRNCGWLDVDIDETRKQIVSFTLSALQIMPSLIKMSKPSKASLGGYTRNIIENLEAVKTARHPFQDAFQLAFENTTAFMQAMTLIAITIRHDIQSVLDCDDFSEMTAMLMDYLKNYIEGDYYKLQFQENLTSGESQHITDLLIEIESNPKLTAQLVEGAKDALYMTDDEEAQVYIANMMEVIRSKLCEEYSGKYNGILRTQSKYVSSASIKVSMLMTGQKNAGNAINRLVLAVENMTDEEYLESDADWARQLRETLSLPVARFPAEKPLYTARAQPKAFSSEVDIIKPRKKKGLTAADLSSCISKYSLDASNRKLRKLLEGRDRITAAELPLETKEDYLDMAALAIFGSDVSSDFHVEFEKGARIQVQGYDCPSFVVTRKGGIAR